eukprot:363643-Chlamydomonas_euryale.AAC.3
MQYAGVHAGMHADAHAPCLKHQRGPAAQLGWGGEGACSHRDTGFGLVLASSSTNAIGMYNSMPITAMIMLVSCSPAKHSRSV